MAWLAANEAVESEVGVSCNGDEDEWDELYVRGGGGGGGDWMFEEPDPARAAVAAAAAAVEDGGD